MGNLREPSMTGFRCNKLRHDCKRDGCYHDQLPDWSDINECFPRSIYPTDIDGMVEINGHILFIEQKSVGASLTKGQIRAFLALSKKPNVTVIAIRPGAQYEMEALFYRRGSGSGWQPMYRSDLLQWFKSWSETADRAEVLA